MNVVAVVVAMALAGCMAQQDPVEEALAIADQVTQEVQGPSNSLLDTSGPKDEEKEEKEEKPTTEAQVAADATNAHKAAKTAKQAANVATKVAKHSIKISEHAKSSLRNAHDALHRARVDSEGLSSDQKKSLKKAEKKLKEATKDAEYGAVKSAKYVKAEVENKKLEKLEKKMDKKKKEKKDEKEDDSELSAMRKELEKLRKKLNAKGDKSDDDALKDLQKQIEQMEKAEKKEDKTDAKSHDEMKAEIERLREMMKDLEASQGDVSKSIPEKKAGESEDEEKKKAKKGKTHPLPAGDDADGSGDSEAVHVDEGKTLDIDTAMPYGDLEPFGREDTAQELTESSINESDEMVDQLERAEVAEEKRAVFRALTRLRGAAITSFDGVARSQTGNIDEYNKIHQWRDTHPLHHLADEESDVSKWAFPDNAD